MDDKFRIDNHKLMFHVKRVSDWLDGKNIYPIYMEVSPIGLCNHRCVFCGLDFMEYKNNVLETERLKKTISELGGLGLKSIMFAGEGEPFLHKDMVEIIKHTKKSGIDVALTTNGTLMKPDVSESILDIVSWIKVSFNAGSPSTYSKIHRTKESDFNKVIENLKSALEIRERKKSKCAIGMQTLLLPENEAEIENLAKTAREIGLDYLVIKPYSHHPQSKTEKFKDITYDKNNELSEKLIKYNTKTFKVIYRVQAMNTHGKSSKSYKCCYGLPFWSYIDSLGNVWGCSVYLNDKRFEYGSIYENSFKEIWEGDKRKESLSFVEKELSPDTCRLNCRIDLINKYLWDLKNPIEHVNFI